MDAMHTNPTLVLSLVKVLGSLLCLVIHKISTLPFTSPCFTVASFFFFCTVLSFPLIIVNTITSYTGRMC